MGFWYDERTDTEYVFDTPAIDVTVTDNPVTHELLGPDGEVIRQWTERPPIGFR